MEDFLKVPLMRKKCYRIYSISAKSMNIVHLNQYAKEFVAYLLDLIAYFLKSMMNMLLAEII